ncbi:hypothetical protein DSECCO2_456670 [anaerobic digester metagenome]
MPAPATAVWFRGVWTSTTDPVTSARAVSVMTLAATRTLNEPDPEAATPMPAATMSALSVASRESVPASTSDSSTRAVTSLTMTLPNPVALTDATPEAATPAVRDAMPESETDWSPTSPVAVTKESKILVEVSLVMTLPVTTPLTATPPVPATLTFTAMMLAEGSTGEAASASLREVRVAASSTDDPTASMKRSALGATSRAARLTSAAVTSASTISEPVVLVMVLPMAVSCTAKPPEPATPMPRVRMTDPDSAVMYRAESVDRTVSLTVVMVESAMEAAAMPTPTAPPPVPATPMARVLISEES